MKAELAPALEDVRRCVPATATPPDGGSLSLRIGVLPGGTIYAAELEGHPEARNCVLSALRQKSTTKPWVGPTVGVTIPLNVENRPGDAGRR